MLGGRDARGKVSMDWFADEISCRRHFPAASLGGMTIEEILSDEALREHEFPVVREKAYLAHAGVCPLPRRVAEAIAGYATDCTHGDQEAVWPADRIADTRRLAAELLGCRSTEIALVGPTSLALSFIAGGLRFEPGDNLLIHFEDFPSNVYPWLALREQGVEVRHVKTRGLGAISLADVEAQVDDRTRLVALASCHFISGYRIDHEAIGRFLRGRGILFSLDAIQTLGAFPTPVEHVDFLAADAHKWLLGPCAAGILYVREELQAELRPPVYGWNNMQCPDYLAREELQPLSGARRYEAGSANLMGLAGLHASLDLLREVGIEAIAAELRRKRAWLTAELVGKGYFVLGEEVEPARQGGMTSFYRDGLRLGEKHRQLREHQIVVSHRKDRTGREYLRFSPHYYNTEAELIKALDLL